MKLSKIFTVLENDPPPPPPPLPPFFSEMGEGWATAEVMTCMLHKSSGKFYHTNCLCKLSLCSAFEGLGCRCDGNVWDGSCGDATGAWGWHCHRLPDNWCQDRTVQAASVRLAAIDKCLCVFCWVFPVFSSCACVCVRMCCSLHVALLLCFSISIVLFFYISFLICVCWVCVCVCLSVCLSACLSVSLWVCVQIVFTFTRFDCVSITQISNNMDFSRKLFLVDSWPWDFGFVLEKNPSCPKIS